MSAARTLNGWTVYLTATHGHPALRCFTDTGVITTTPVVMFDRDARAVRTRSGSRYVLGENLYGAKGEAQDFDRIERALVERALHRSER